MTMKTQVVIVGAGPSGLFQVFELGLLGISVRVRNSVSLRLPGIEQHHGANLHYKITDRQGFASKQVVILGGGDSALGIGPS